MRVERCENLKVNGECCSLKALRASLELDNASCEAFTHTIGFPRGSPTQLARDRQIIVLTLATTVSEWPYMIGLLSVTDGLG